MNEITLVEAVQQSLAYAMREDDRIVLMGEDIGLNGGVFRATAGLMEEFGAARVLDTPLAESMLAGLAVGMSATGLKPIVEFQFMDFMYPALDQIIDHLCRMRNRTRGRLTCPAVIRAPYGGGIHAPEHHSESMEAILTHIPGLRVLIPSSPLRAYGLLLAAIRDPDPVIFLEPKRIYRLHKQAVPNNGKALPLDRAFVLKEGTDVTLISWGAMLQESLKAAKTLEAQQISAEVIDLCSIKPIDEETLLNSVSKTGRCVIIHEAAKSCGVGAEVAAILAEKGLLDLLAPIVRVTGYDTIVPYPQLEHYYMPSEKRIVHAVQSLMEYS